MSNRIILKCKNCLLIIHLYEEEEPIVRRVESTKEVDIYLNLIGKHKLEIHLSIKNMNINEIYKYMYTGVQTCALPIYLSIIRLDTYTIAHSESYRNSYSPIPYSNFTVIYLFIKLFVFLTNKQYCI